MHCPRCGQEQVSEDIKFCSRCGFPLGLVSEILSQGGFLPQLADFHKTPKPKFTKKHGVVLSVFWFIFFVPLLTSFFGGILGIEELGAICALIGVFGGLMILIASLSFLKSAPKELPMSLTDMQQPNVHNLSGRRQNQNALPPQQAQPVNSYIPPQPGSWKAPNTGELVNPGSVIDHTTKLLQKDK